ncbi:hypothetical protein D3C86_2147260 [compost metagenome]
MATFLLDPIGSAHTTSNSVAMNRLAAEKVIERDDQTLNQRWKPPRLRLSLVFWRVQDCWSRRKKTWIFTSAPTIWL